MVPTPPHSAPSDSRVHLSHRNGRHCLREERWWKRKRKAVLRWQCFLIQLSDSKNESPTLTAGRANSSSSSTNRRRRSRPANHGNQQHSASGFPFTATAVRQTQHYTRSATGATTTDCLNTRQTALNSTLVLAPSTSEAWFIAWNRMGFIKKQTAAAGGTHTHTRTHAHTRKHTRARADLADDLNSHGLEHGGGARKSRATAERVVVRHPVF